LLVRRKCGGVAARRRAIPLVSPPDQKETPVPRKTPQSLSEKDSRALLELVRAAQSGSSDAIDMLLALIQPKVYSLALRRLRNHHDAEDQAQNVLLEVFEHLHSLADPARFDAWLKRLVHHRCTDRLRRRFNVEARVEYHEELVAPAPAPGPCSSVAASPELAAVVNSLSRPLRETLELHYFQNCSLKEISARLNVPLNTVKRRLHDARQKLRQRSTLNSAEKIASAPNLCAAPFDKKSVEVEETTTEPARVTRDDQTVLE
jgi:RNA polymerase sigma factor (sigma-70 family)